MLIQRGLQTRALFLGKLEQRRLPAEKCVILGRGFHPGPRDHPGKKRPHEERHPQDRRIAEEIEQNGLIDEG